MGAFMPKHERNGARYKTLGERIKYNTYEIAGVGMFFNKEYSPCHLWSGAIVRRYPRISVHRGWANSKDKKLIATHRLSLLLHEWGEIKTNEGKEPGKDCLFMILDILFYSGLQADHLCRNAECVNGRHLQWVEKEVNLELRGKRRIMDGEQRNGITRLEIAERKHAMRLAERGQLLLHFDGHYQDYKGE